MNEWRRKDEAANLAPDVVAQATMRLRSELECERMIRLAHQMSIASATAYRSPEDGGTPILAMFIDEPKKIEEFLPEARQAAPSAPISVIREQLLHVSPTDFLSGGVFRPRPFRTEASHLFWVCAGGALGAGGRLLLETVAEHLDPNHATFPWGTIAVNVMGSFAIAILGTLIFERFMEERERMFWVLGFLGSFTTFSSYALQTSETWETSHLLGILYGAGSLVLGLLGALLGMRLTRRNI